MRRNPFTHSGHVPSKSHRILVADDDAEMRTLISDSFAGVGFDTIQVGSGLALFDELRRLRQNGTVDDLSTGVLHLLNHRHEPLERARA